MSISSITPASTLSALGSQDPGQSWRKDFRQLSQALSSGDLTSAQTAFAALTQDQANAPNSPANQNSPLAQDFQSIGKALQSGDIQGAQTAFGKLQQDAQTQRAGVSGAHHGHGGHHHHAAPVDPDATTDPLATPTSTLDLTL